MKSIKYTSDNQILIPLITFQLFQIVLKRLAFKVF